MSSTAKHTKFFASLQIFAWDIAVQLGTNRLTPTFMSRAAIGHTFSLLAEYLMVSNFLISFRKTYKRDAEYVGALLRSHPADNACSVDEGRVGRHMCILRK